MHCTLNISVVQQNKNCVLLAITFKKVYDSVLSYSLKSFTFATHYVIDGLAHP